MRISRRLLSAICAFSFLPAFHLFAQSMQPLPVLQQIENADDPCGFDPILSKAQVVALGPGWGYNYDSLLVDLKTWRQSPYVVIDSVGASVQNRALWRLYSLRVIL